jgi:hypothetical protein
MRPHLVNTSVLHLAWSTQSYLNSISELQVLVCSIALYCCHLAVANALALCWCTTVCPWTSRPYCISCAWASRPILRQTLHVHGPPDSYSNGHYMCMHLQTILHQAQHVHGLPDRTPLGTTCAWTPRPYSIRHYMCMDRPDHTPLGTTCAWTSRPYGYQALHVHGPSRPYSIRHYSIAAPHKLDVQATGNY